MCCGYWGHKGTYSSPGDKACAHSLATARVYLAELATENPCPHACLLVAAEYLEAKFLEVIDESKLFIKPNNTVHWCKSSILHEESRQSLLNWDSIHYS